MSLHKMLLPAVVLVAQIVPLAAAAYTQERFFALWQEYQRFCGQMLLAPEQFHANLNQNFGPIGESYYSATDDLSIKNYDLGRNTSFSAYPTGYSIKSIKISEHIDQSCYVSDDFVFELPTGLTARNFEMLSVGIIDAFSAAPGLKIKGGKYVSAQEHDTGESYAFTVIGAFADRNIVTYVSISDIKFSIEHTNLTVLSE